MLSLSLPAVEIFWRCLCSNLLASYQVNIAPASNHIVSKWETIVFCSVLFCTVHRSVVLDGFVQTCMQSYNVWLAANCLIAIDGRIIKCSICVACCLPKQVMATLLSSEKSRKWQKLFYWLSIFVCIFTKKLSFLFLHSGTCLSHNRHVTWTKLKLSFLCTYNDKEKCISYK